jgi:hypothetical protein
MKILIEKHDIYGYEKFNVIWTIGYHNETGEFAMMFDDDFNRIKIYKR